MFKLTRFIGAVLLVAVVAIPAAALERAGTVERQKGDATRTQGGESARGVGRSASCVVGTVHGSACSSTQCSWAELHRSRQLHS